MRIETNTIELDIDYDVPFGDIWVNIKDSESIACTKWAVEENLRFINLTGQYKGK